MPINIDIIIISINGTNELGIIAHLHSPTLVNGTFLVLHNPLVDGTVIDGKDVSGLAAFCVYHRPDATSIAVCVAVFSNNGNFGAEATYFLNITNNGSGQFVGIESATNATTLSVYPNPVCDELRVECGEAIRNIEILDVTGRTVYSTGNCDGTIDTDGWQSGMYILRVTTDSGMSVQKFVKQ